MSHDAELAARTVEMPLTLLPFGVLPERTGWMRIVRAVAADVILATGVVFCIPLVILAVGIPIALAVRLLFWLAGLI